jgi:IclR family transcriptional regulator, acetate operon repressor
MPETLQSVDAALRALRVLQGGEALGATELASRLSLGTSTAQRIVATLAAAGFVEQTTARRYRIVPVEAPEIVARREIERCVEIAGPVIDALCESTTETVHISVLSGWRAEFVAVRESPRRVRVSSKVGEAMPAHATASGKCLLAELDDELVVERAPGERLDSLSESTITSLPELLEELARIRRQGFSVNATESEDAVIAFAVPIRRRLGPAFCALTVAAPAARLPTTGPAAVRTLETLNEAADTIHRALIA